MEVKLRDNQSVRAPPWKVLNEVEKHFAVAVEPHLPIPSGIRL